MSLNKKYSTIAGSAFIALMAGCSEIDTGVSSGSAENTSTTATQNSTRLMEREPIQDEPYDRPVIDYTPSTPTSTSSWKDYGIKLAMWVTDGENQEIRQEQ